ncbi:hypothetical protein J6590_007478 [Homalodisca vitripennis]|nr:hypothetical protein J6590_007478 [Homalodisca vitripennis]
MPVRVLEQTMETNQNGNTRTVAYWSCGVEGVVASSVCESLPFATAPPPPASSGSPLAHLRDHMKSLSLYFLHHS